MAALNHSTIIKGFEKLAEVRNPEDFFLGFLKALKFSASTIRRLKDPSGNRNVANIPGDYALAGQIYFHPVASEGGVELCNLLNNIEISKVIQKSKIRFFLATDFENVAAYDHRVDDWTSFAFSDLRENYEFFLPLTGQYEKPLAYSAHPADVKACEKMGRLYDVIRALNHYEKDHLHDLNVFLARLLFCFFAEDTGIFPIAGQLTAAVESLTKADGSDLPDFFARLFRVLDMPMDRPERCLESARLAAFPYVNGGLFREEIRIPVFSAKARSILIECGRLAWKDISPVIFGSMFQSVMDPEKRHELGAHYTSEKNIFKVIGPLFLDDLKEELNRILEGGPSHRVQRLKAFQDKLASLQIADPACGSGNFLVVSYRELKLLELKAVEAMLKSRTSRDRSIFMDWKAEYSKVSISQFHGIEIEEFPVDIARVSLWLMEHVMNCQFGKLLGQVIPSIPLKASARIVCANALTTDWAQAFPVHQLSCIIGNPPFGGALVMGKDQKAELMSLFPDVKSAGKLDYVAAWYRKTAELMGKNPGIQAAFVSTNSICEGEQVAPLWGNLFEQGVHINFAHQTFQWRNEAKDNAGVYCVVIGFGKAACKHKRLFSYETPKSDPIMSEVGQINAYLLEADEKLFVKSRSKALSAKFPMLLGNMPVDGGNLIIEAADYDKFAEIESLRPYIKKLMGSRELLHNLTRYCLWLVDAPEEVLRLPLVAERIERCRAMRLGSRDPGCNRLAARPHEFRDLNNPETAIAVPRVSSERREYIPMGFVSKDTILTDLCHMIPNGTLFDFGILESRMHMTWMRTVCGRLESRYRYSRDLCYNTFPWPGTSENQRKLIENLAQNVLVAREFYPDMTLADLYGPDKMPGELRKAHQELDLAVERLYRKKPFASDEDRLHHLFARYGKLVKGEDDASLFSSEE